MRKIIILTAIIAGASVLAGVILTRKYKKAKILDIRNVNIKQDSVLDNAVRHIAFDLLSNSDVHFENYTAALNAIYITCFDSEGRLRDDFYDYITLVYDRDIRYDYLPDAIETFVTSVYKVDLDDIEDFQDAIAEAADIIKDDENDLIEEETNSQDESGIL